MYNKYTGCDVLFSEHVQQVHGQGVYDVQGLLQTNLRQFKVRQGKPTCIMGISSNITFKPWQICPFCFNDTSIEDCYIGDKREHVKKLTFIFFYFKIKISGTF